MKKPSTRTSKRGEQTREQILVAARQLFTEHGYHQTSVYDLFEKAGITKGAFFHHWKSKEELALSVLEELKADFERNFFESPRAGRGRERLKLLLFKLSELSCGGDWPHGRILALWCAELRTDEGRMGPAVHALRQRWTDLWRQALADAQREHDIRQDVSAENLSFFAVAAIFGVLMVSDRAAVEKTRGALQVLGRTVFGLI